MRKGFTLVEILIAIVVMTIAFFAVLAVQGTAIGAYNSSRDSTEAIELAKNVTEYLQLEAAQWTMGNLASVTSMYDASSSPFDTAPVLPALAGTGFDEWTPLVNAAIDNRFARGGTVTGTKFCVFARGAYVEADTTDLNQFNTSNVLTGSPLFRVQLAIVYAGATASIPVDGSGVQDCTLIDTGLLTPDALENLEMTGLRASYFGTVVVRRDYGI